MEEGFEFSQMERHLFGEASSEDENEVQVHDVSSEWAKWADDPSKHQNLELAMRILDISEEVLGNFQIVQCHSINLFDL